MAYIIIIIIASFAMIMFFLYIFADNDNVKATAFTMQLISLMAIIIVGLIESKTERVKPIDVYRGKTTLQITYQDSIPIDSVVVFR